MEQVSIARTNLELKGTVLAVADSLYYFATDSIHVYEDNDEHGGCWRCVERHQQHHKYNSVVSVMGRWIVFFGGENKDREFTLRTFDLQSLQWHLVPVRHAQSGLPVRTALQSRLFPALVHRTFSDSLVMACGLDNVCCNEVLEFCGPNFSDPRWTMGAVTLSEIVPTGSAVITPRCASGSAYRGLDDSLLVFGGHNGESGALCDLWQFLFQSRRWRKLGSIVEPLPPIVSVRSTLLYDRFLVTMFRNTIVVHNVDSSGCGAAVVVGQWHHIKVPDEDFCVSHVRSSKSVPRIYVCGGYGCSDQLMHLQWMVRGFGVELPNRLFHSCKRALLTDVIVVSGC